MDYADVRWPAPDALCEALIRRMESYLTKSTINGSPVYRRCLGNVNDIFDNLGGQAKFRGENVNAAYAANALRSIADSETVPPRGVVCLWDTRAGSGDGHIAYSDGNGHSVNNWGGHTVERTALSQQRTGYVGWVHPRHLGAPPPIRGTNPAYDGPDTGSISSITTGGGTGSSSDTPREPLPKPPNMKAGSGRSVLRLGSDEFTLTGRMITADLSPAITSIGLDLAPEQVAQLTLTVLDPDELLTGIDMRGATLSWDDAQWDLAAASLSAAATTHTLAARSQLARRMRRTYRVVGQHKADPDRWITNWITGLGGTCTVEPAARRAVIPESTDQSLWDALAGLCSDLGWSFVEYGGHVLAGSRWWAANTITATSRTWPLTWKNNPGTDLLDAAAELTSDDPANRGVATFTLRRDQAVRMRPWQLAQLDGLGVYDGRWLIETVTIPDNAAEPAQISCAKPRRGGQNPDQPTPTSGREPKDRTTPAWAKWHAKRQLAGRGWNTDQQWPALENLWDRESGWNYRAANPSSGAYGIPQALPAAKMAAAGDDWRTNPATQIRWGLGYIKDRYATPTRAWAHFQQNGWY